jgi:hypothetical protein
MVSDLQKSLTKPPSNPLPRGGRRSLYVFRALHPSQTIHYPLPNVTSPTPIDPLRLQPRAFAQIHHHNGNYGIPRYSCVNAHTRLCLVPPKPNDRCVIVYVQCVCVCVCVYVSVCVCVRHPWTTINRTCRWKGVMYVRDVCVCIRLRVLCVHCVCVRARMAEGILGHKNGNNGNTSPLWLPTPIIMKLTL